MNLHQVIVKIQSIVISSIRLTVRVTDVEVREIVGVISSFSSLREACVDTGVIFTLSEKVQYTVHNFT